MNTIIDQIRTLPYFVCTHVRVFLIVGLVVALVGSAAMEWHRARRPIRAQYRTDGSMTLLNDYEPEHAVSAGYDGEGVYAWSCTCGAGQSDYQGLEDATIFGAVHLDDMGEIPAAAS